MYNVGDLQTMEIYWNSLAGYHFDGQETKFLFNSDTLASARQCFNDPRRNR